MKLALCLAAFLAEGHELSAASLLQRSKKTQRCPETPLWGVFIDGKSAGAGPEAFGANYSALMSQALRRNAASACAGAVEERARCSLEDFERSVAELKMAMYQEVGLMEMDEPAGVAFRGIYHCLHRALPVEELQKMFRTDLDSVYDERCILAAGVPCRRYNVPVRQSLLRLFESYHAALDQSVSDPLALLSSLLKGLALLHPLPDRNGRSRLLLLQRELRRLNLACGTMNYNNNNNDSVETYTLKLREGIAMYEEAAASQRNPWLDPTKAAKHLTTFPVKFEKEMRECYQTYGPNIGVGLLPY
ncbi:unnamed protein product [Effrenium voratum]|nr:unnamed protein product [Effrenium voratum]